MKIYCVSCKKYTANEKRIVKKKTKQNRLTHLSNCAVCGEKMSFIKNK